jgi:glycine reductase
VAVPVRVVHYINQFFGGIGGEEHANIPPEVRPEPVGPGNALNIALGDDGSVVATIVAGDNYVVEEAGAFETALDKIIAEFKPDVIVAGPAFEAGRYGLAAAELCKAVQARGIPAVTAMYPDNPGVLTHGKEILCVPTGTSTAGMAAVLNTVAALAVKLGRGEEIGAASDEGYLPRGLRKFVMRAKSGAERAADLLKARLAGEEAPTEVYLSKYESIAAPAAIDNFSDKTVALVTTGAVVPTGNPDNMPPLFATSYYKYSIDGLAELGQGDWESVHAGFNTDHINTHDPNYALPLNAARALEADGTIKSIYPEMFSLAGVATAVAESQKFGAEMAEEISSNGIDAVLLVAT